MADIQFNTAVALSHLMDEFLDAAEATTYFAVNQDDFTDEEILSALETSDRRLGTVWDIFLRYSFEHQIAVLTNLDYEDETRSKHFPKGFDFDGK